MSKLDKELAKFNVRQAQKDEIKHNSSEWPLCQAQGCKLHSSHKAGSPLCTYHAGQDVMNWTAITQAIDENKGLITKLARITHSTSAYWSDPLKLAAMRGWDALPMGENEPASLYLYRLNIWVRKQINDRASELLGAK